mmetsp:Transcript_12228/g.19563  ORF Transcript_12228/g.19563 Transcript_12228/m.19563 type:complete len:119 (+) Transcript_12228:514-870(+)
MYFIFSASIFLFLCHRHPFNNSAAPLLRISLKDVMKEMSRGTSMNDVEFIQKKFDDWDKDNSGHIDSAELRDLCIACGIPLSGAEAEVAYNILDTDRNGKIDKKEFVVWWKTQSRAWA